MGKGTLILLVAACILVATLVVVHRTGSISGDPGFTLMVSQSIIENHTIKLDRYMDRINPYHFAILHRNGHYYYIYPLGTSVLSVPVVAVANLMGKDMVDFRNSTAFQIGTIAVINPLVLLLLFLIGRYYVSDIAALFIAAVSFLGSSLTSSLSIALWSHNFTVLFTTLVLLILVRRDAGRINSTDPYLLGVLLFLAYFCRPTSAVFIMVVFAYLFFSNRKALLKAGLTSLSLLLCFSAFSFYEYGQVLPPYYFDLPGGHRIQEGFSSDSGILTAIYGIMFSPSRGLFVFSPFLLLVAMALVWYFRRLKAERIFLLSVVWGGLHLLLLAKWDVWSGGHSFGPRLLVDSLPAYILITFILWRHIARSELNTARYAVIGVYALLGLVGLWINSYQGLFNVWVDKWNMYPDLSKNPSVVFNWRYPQFLASGEMIREKLISHYGPGKRYIEIDYENHEVLDMEISQAVGFFLSRAVYHENSANPESALEDFSRALELDPQNAITKRRWRASAGPSPSIWRTPFHTRKEATLSISLAISGKRPRTMRDVLSPIQGLPGSKSPCSFR
jgi:hypothetical protein